MRLPTGCESCAEHLHACPRLLPADQSKGSATGAFVPRPSAFMPGPPTGGMPPQPMFAPPKPPSSPGGSARGADGTLAEQGGPALFKPYSGQDAGPGSAAAAAAAAAQAAQPKAAPAAAARQGVHLIVGGLVWKWAG